MNETEKVEFSVNLPPPLDKPMEKLSGDVSESALRIHYTEKAVNELIERQNEILEIIKILMLKGKSNG